MEALRHRLETLPHAPGVYLFKDRRGRLLYVGKAKDLRVRVQSYFTERGELRALLPYLKGEAAELEWLVTGNEYEALLLEQSLIRKERPKYNIRLRDDKNYVSLRYDPRESFPRLEIVRRVERDGARYLGPFLSAGAVRETLRVLLPLFPLRLCSDAVFRNRTRPCVYHDIGRCPAPCVGLVSPEAYRANLEGALRFLRGETQEVLTELEARMWAAAEAENFEVAARLRDRIAALKRTLANVQSLPGVRRSADALAVLREGDRVAVGWVAVREGRLVGARAQAFRTPVSAAEVLRSFVVQHYGELGREVPPEVFLDRPLAEAETLAAFLRDRRGAKVALRVPQRGLGARLLETARENAREALRRQTAGVDEEAALEALAEALGLEEPPRRLEAVDISHTGGGETAGSVVTFQDGTPDRSGYRLYRIRGAAAGDDYEALAELVRRRFTRLLTEDRPLPDLLLVDGGKGQLERVRRVLREVGVDPAEVTLVALAKGRTEGGRRLPRTARQEKLYLLDREGPVRLPAQSEALRLLDRLRDEAHRFAVTYHRKLRTRARVGSALDEIPGVGPRYRARILKAFGSLEGLKGKSAREIADRARVPYPVAEAVAARFG